MSPTRRDILKTMTVAPLASLLPATVLAEDWSEDDGNDDDGNDDDPTILHTARFEMAFFMEDGRPITLYIESEFDVDGGI